MHSFGPVLGLYVDPGSGSMVLQLLLGGVSGIYVIFRMFKQKILGIFGIHPEPKPPSGSILPETLPDPEDHPIGRST